jgi:Fe-S-cluster containining protein
VIEDSIITVVDATGACERESRGEGRVIRLVLDVLGEAVDLVIDVKDERARLADIVPLAREVSTKITDKVGEIARLNGATIPCGKGCSACCNYLVPLSVPDVFRLKEEVLDMPLVRQLLIDQGCLSAARRVLAEQPPASFAEMATAAVAESAAELLSITSNWYADFELTCPFLCERVCTIYEERPMACREHSVTGCSRACADGACEADGVYIPARMSEVLGRLASELEGTTVEGLIMPLALIWADENSKRDERTWPAPMMVERFVEIVCEELPKSSAETVSRV